MTYENSQARERTQVLMDIANQEGGLVVGTGDLSELALGWATYNGDHMSMYAVNASVPKTLVRHLVRYVADTCGNDEEAQVLYDVLDTPVSPELLPAEKDGTIAQRTEDLVGPYELHDFFLYEVLRRGTPPRKAYRLARYALGDTYDDATILKWEKTFYRRYFAQQFKRSCLPDGPKVGSAAVSPRGDLRMPSDACAALWLPLACAVGFDASPDAGGYSNSISPVFASMDFTMASDSTSKPFSRRRLPPGWKPFSTAMPMPSTMAPACSQISMRPSSAHPLARKSSMMRTCSPLLRKRLATMTVLSLPWV